MPSNPAGKLTVMTTIDLHDHDPAEVVTIIPPGGTPRQITISALFLAIAPPDSVPSLSDADIREWVGRVGARFTTDAEMQQGDWG